MKTRSTTLALCTLLAWLAPVSNALEPVSPKAVDLVRFLEAMEVDKYWQPGVIVDWKTGYPTGKPITDNGNHTHCSQFVAAACERLGLYILRPPEHSAVLLANAQHDWLASEPGIKSGWSPLGSHVQAQDGANRGELVVAVYKSADPKKSGHIAIVRPGEKTEAQLALDGPEVIQAGGTNSPCTSLRKGFANHKKGYADIRFYRAFPAHPSTSSANTETYWRRTINRQLFDHRNRIALSDQAQRD